MDGISYSFSTTVTNFVAKMNSFYNIFINYIVAVDETNKALIFTKRNKDVKEFTFSSANSHIFEFIIGSRDIADINYSIGLSVLDESNNILANLSKATPLEGDVTFDISSILKNNISHNFILRNTFDVFATYLLKKFQLSCSAISNSSTNSIIDIYAAKTNISVEEFGSLVTGKLLCTNKSVRYVSDYSNEKLFFVGNTANTTLTITAYTYLRKSKEVYTKDISSLSDKIIYEIPTSWRGVKGLFSTLDETDIVEYVVKIGDEEITYIRKDFVEYHEFVFVNKYSVWDNIIFDAKNEQVLDVQKQDITSKENIITISKTTSKKRLQNTGFISTQAKREHLEDFFSSEKVFEMINGIKHQVIINADSYTLKQLDIREMNNIQFEYVLATTSNII
ncbi:MAG: hypothetical protein VB122_01595 [Erysipelotrichales bacterium]|nr:hypothetical protein [Erysipelotrichales bacterium]